MNVSLNIIINYYQDYDHIVQYEEQYVMDSWELIYQLGGVVGMWKGWSALSVISILNNLFFITFLIKYKL